MGRPERRSVQSEIIRREDQASGLIVRESFPTSSPPLPKICSSFQSAESVPVLAATVPRSARVRQSSARLHLTSFPPSFPPFTPNASLRSPTPRTKCANPLHALPAGQRSPHSPHCTRPADLLKDRVGGNAIIHQVTKRLVASTAPHMDCSVSKGRQTAAIMPNDGPDVKNFLLSSSVLPPSPNRRQTTSYCLRK
jgi:hypothetical protein